MRVSMRLAAAVFAAAFMLTSVSVQADDEEKPAAKTEKAPEKPAPADADEWKGRPGKLSLLER